MTKKILLWAIALIITFCAVVYQRKTGPTNPQKENVTIEGKDYTLKFPRSATTDNTLVVFDIDQTTTQATLFYRNHQSADDFTALTFFQNEDKKLSVNLPEKKALDKIDYFVEINGQQYFAQEPLVLRYKDPVPALWLISHIVLMFFSMLFAAYGLLIAIVDRSAGKKLLNCLYVTTLTLIAGGFILGSIVQKYAFGVYWTGFPVGTDVTDNKTLFALIALLVALPFTRKKYFRYIAIAAFAVMFLIFCIPHSIA